MPRAPSRMRQDEARANAERSTHGTYGGQGRMLLGIYAHAWSFPALPSLLDQCVPIGIHRAVELPTRGGQRWHYCWHISDSQRYSWYRHGQCQRWEGAAERDRQWPAQRGVPAHRGRSRAVGVSSVAHHAAGPPPDPYVRSRTVGSRQTPF